jgi:hypothetical protein
MKICSICGHPKVMEINQKLLSGIQRLVVAREYALSPPAMYRHWHDHVPHDDLYEIDKAMKSWKDILYKEQKKTNPDRMVIKDCDLRLAALRGEKRTLESIQQQLTPKKIEPGNPESIEFTVEGLDALIRHHLKQPNMQSPEDRLWGKLYKIPRHQRVVICEQIIAMLPSLMISEGFAKDEYDRLPLLRTSFREN